MKLVRVCEIGQKIGRRVTRENSANRVGVSESFAKSREMILLLARWFDIAQVVQVFRLGKIPFAKSMVTLLSALNKVLQEVREESILCFSFALFPLHPLMVSLLLSSSSSLYEAETRERPRAKSFEWNRRNLKNILNLITPTPTLGLSKSSGLPMAGWKIADRRTERTRHSGGVAFVSLKKRERRKKRLESLNPIVNELSHLRERYLESFMFSTIRRNIFNLSRNIRQRC